MQYVVEDASGDTEVIHFSDIITDAQDSLLPLSVSHAYVCVRPKHKEYCDLRSKECIVLSTAKRQCSWAPPRLFLQLRSW